MLSSDDALTPQVRSQDAAPVQVSISESKAEGDLRTESTDWQQETRHLFRFYAENADFRSSSCVQQSAAFMSLCIDLARRDHSIELIDNQSGQLCWSYPPMIILMDHPKPPDFDTLVVQAQFARVHSRFPVPAVTVLGHSLLRSSTVAIGAESAFRNMILKWSLNFNHSDQKVADSQLLRAFGVKHIVDLTVDNHMRKFGLAMCSSEKAEPHDYYHKYFDIHVMPYPGCEYMKRIAGEQHHPSPTGRSPVTIPVPSADDSPDDGHVDSAHRHGDRSASPSAAAHSCRKAADCDKETIVLCREDEPSIDGWHTSLVVKSPLQMDADAEFRSWRWTNLTRRYLRMVLAMLGDVAAGHGSSLAPSVDLHCISGWDRSAMFISLVRLSLWADGLVHQSLTESEILFFSIAYDWMFFTHQLKLRLRRKEEVMLFGFRVLKYIADQAEFGFRLGGQLVVRTSPETRRQRLLAVATLFEQFYASCVEPLCPHLVVVTGSAARLGVSESPAPGGVR